MSGADSLTALQERIRAAGARGASLRLRGAGSKDFYGEALEGEILDLRPYQGIVHYEPSELVVTARCGTPLARLEEILAAEGQFLACEPPRLSAETTLGGAVAAGLSGPRRMYAGAVRDFVLGTKLVDARGEALRFGGEVMKNVAGFDISRLLCGSLGILGVIAEVSLKVLPLPRVEATVRLAMPAASAVQAFNHWAGEPLPLSATAWCEGAAWVRLSGAAPAVSAARTRIGGELIDAHTAHAFWTGLRDLKLPFFGQPSLWRVSLPATAAPLAIDSQPLIEWGGAVRWYAGVPAEQDVRARAMLCGGTALCWRGSCEGSRFHPLAGTTLQLHRRLKQRFDPGGLFNRNRLIAGL
jgi:glycolate oxidase FAD binding subunit